MHLTLFIQFSEQYDLEMNSFWNGGTICFQFTTAPSSNTAASWVRRFLVIVSLRPELSILPEREISANGIVLTICSHICNLTHSLYFGCFQCFEKNLHFI